MFRVPCLSYLSIIMKKYSLLIFLFILLFSPTFVFAFSFSPSSPQSINQSITPVCASTHDLYQAYSTTYDNPNSDPNILYTGALPCDPTDSSFTVNPSDYFLPGTFI